jgi:hypothetical protein
VKQLQPPIPQPLLLQQVPSAEQGHAGLLRGLQQFEKTSLHSSSHCSDPPEM